MKQVGQMDFIGDLRKRVAGLAIGPSTLRNMVGPTGIEIARAFCSGENFLRRIRHPNTFVNELDSITEELAAKLPKRKVAGGNTWGPSRKLLNIFLSDATYNTYLREEYELARIEDCLEVPLDSFVAIGIVNDVLDLKLLNKFDPWRGVVHVTPPLNAAYQSAATDIAKLLDYRCRGHLDLRYWRQRSPKS